MTNNTSEVIKMEFTKIELHIIYHVLTEGYAWLQRRMEISDGNYKNNMGECGITYEDFDIFLFDEIGKLIEKMQGAF